MAKFSLSFDMDNAAFESALDENARDGREVARILRELADRLEERPLTESDGGPVRDGNGNRVGRWEVDA